MRTPVMAANWKMFKTATETRDYFARFLPLVASTRGREIVVCPPFVDLPEAAAAVEGTNVESGAQNLHWANEGAYTGEISAPMLIAAGARWVIVGHSERRQYFAETDAGVFRKTQAALAAGLKPIVCIGETLDEREAGNTTAVLERQVRDGLSALSDDQFSRIVIAYEPVWAIGTGRTATPGMAQEAHAFIRGLLPENIAADLRILYGGSVKPGNARDLMAQPDIDGALVGGASLDPDSFALIVNY